jgi:hypothetical protein
MYVRHDISLSHDTRSVIIIIISLRNSGCPSRGIKELAYKHNNQLREYRAQNFDHLFSLFFSSSFSSLFSCSRLIPTLAKSRSMSQAVGNNVRVSESTSSYCHILVKYDSRRELCTVREMKSALYS